MASGLELFYPRTAGPAPDFVWIEDQMGHALPESYKRFQERYDTGDYHLRFEQVMHPRFQQLVPVGSIVFRSEEPPLEVYFNGFFSLEELATDWETYGRDEVEWTENGWLRIGSFDPGGGIFLAVKGDEAGRVHLVEWDGVERSILLADDVFSLARKIRFVRDGANMDGFTYDQLIQQPGEDFWRVR